MCVLGGGFIGKWWGISITGNIIESPKGLEPRVEKLQESLSLVSHPSSLTPSLSQCGFSPWLHTGHQFHTPVSVDLLSLSLTVHGWEWFQYRQPSFHSPSLQGTETAEKVLFQFFFFFFSIREQSGVNLSLRLVYTALIFSQMMNMDLSWNEFTESNCSIFLLKKKFQGECNLSWETEVHISGQKAFCSA